ncbi:MAG: MobA/MobL family protein [Thalassobaculaceae bacterium]
MKELKDFGVASYREFEDEAWKLGRLDDSDERTLGRIARGKYLHLNDRLLGWPVGGSSRPKSPGGAVTFHFAHTTVSKRRSMERIKEREARYPGRLYVFPQPREVAEVKEAGGRKDRWAGAWYLPHGRWQHNAEPIARMASPEARERWRSGRARGRAETRRGARKTGSDFQAYIERARNGQETREREIECDEKGQISFGNIGDTPGERARFWEQVAERERADGRVQCRIIAELPCEVTPAGRRRIVEELVEEFERKRLPYHAAVHLPDVRKGMDPRNVHLHVIYHDRPVLYRIPAEEVRRDGDGRSGSRWEFADKKDRTAQGKAWIAGLRERHCDAMNWELLLEDVRRRAEGREPTGKTYSHLSYREMEVDKIPTRHLGPVSSAFERSGRPTKVGVENAQKERKFEIAEFEREIGRRRKVLEALETIQVAAEDRLRDPQPTSFNRSKVENSRAYLEDTKKELALTLREGPVELSPRIARRSQWLLEEQRRLSGQLVRSREDPGDRALGTRQRARRKLSLVTALHDKLVAGDRKGERRPRHWPKFSPLIPLDRAIVDTIETMRQAGCRWPHRRREDDAIAKWIARIPVNETRQEIRATVERWTGPVPSNSRDRGVGIKR